MIHAYPLSTPRPARPSRLPIVGLVVTLLAVAAGGWGALAQPLHLVPAYVFVLEAEPIEFLRAPDAPGLAVVRGVGVQGDTPLQVAWFEADEDRLTVSLRLVGDRTVTFDGLMVARGSDVEPLTVGQVTIAPALAETSDRLATAYEHHDPGSGVIGAGIVENLSPMPMTLRRIELLPQESSAGVPVRIHEGPGQNDAFLQWIGSLTASMGGLGAPLPPGTAPEAAFPERLAQRMVEGGTQAQWIDPSATDVVLPPGASLFWAVTPASFPTDVRAASVVVAPRFVFEGDEGACCEAVPSAGTFTMSWIR